MDAEAIQDLFQELGIVRIRRMFGGKGIYFDGRIFALEAGGEIYLKTDDETLATFRSARSRPFTFDKDGRSISTSYWLMPSEAFDDPAEAAHWGRLAVEAAERAASRPKKAGRRA